MISFSMKRSKLLLGIIIGVLVIAFATIFALAKTGVIDIKMLADEVPNATMEIDLLNNQPAPNNAFGAGAMIITTKNGQIIGNTAVTIEVVENNIKRSIATIPNLVPATQYLFTAQVPMCSGSGTFTTGANGTVVRNTITMSCTTGDPGTPVEATTYKLTGTIRDSVTKAAIPGATVSGPTGISPATDTTGIYTLSNIPFTNVNDLVAHQFTFSAPDYQPLTVNLRILGIDPTQLVANGTYMGNQWLTKTSAGNTTPPNPTPGPGTFSFKGRVVNAANPTSGMANVQVTCRTQNGSTATVYTDAQGYYSFINFSMVFVNNKSIGSYYYLYFTKIGYTTINKNLGMLGINTITPSTTILNLKPDVGLAVAPGETAVVGSVKNDEGNLVQGVVVKITKVSGSVTNTFSAVSSATAITDSSIATAAGGTANYMIPNVSRPQTGNATWVKVSLSGIPAGYIWDTSPGHQNADLQLSMTTFTKADFTIKRDAVTLYGKVKSPEGLFIPNVGISLESNGTVIASTTSSATSQPQFGTVTNYNYKIANIPKTNLQLVAKLTGIPAGYIASADSYPITLSATDQLQAFDFTLDKYQATVWGNVKDDEGALLPNVTITLKADGNTVGTGISQPQNVPTSGVTESHNYAIAGVPKNILVITAELSNLPTGYTSDVASLTMTAAGELFSINLVANKPMPEAISIIGTVKGTGDGKTQLADNVEMVVYPLHTLKRPFDQYTARSSKAQVDSIPQARVAHNFRVDNVKPSESGKYAIWFKNTTFNYETRVLRIRTTLTGGYEAKVIPYTSLVKVSGNVYRIPEDAVMTKDLMVDWNKYKVSKAFKRITGFSSYEELVKVFQ